MKKLLFVLLLAGCAEQPVLDIYGSTPSNPGWYQGCWAACEEPKNNGDASSKNGDVARSPKGGV